MKRELVLNQPGVIELGRDELKEVDGGWIGVVLAVGSAYIYLYNNSEDWFEGFREGWKDGQK